MILRFSSLFIMVFALLLELRDTKINAGGDMQRMLDEVDLISSVSGGITDKLIGVEVG